MFRTYCMFGIFAREKKINVLKIYVSNILDFFTETNNSQDKTL